MQQIKTIWRITRKKCWAWSGPKLLDTDVIPDFFYIWKNTQMKTQHAKS